MIDDGPPGAGAHRIMLAVIDEIFVASRDCVHDVADGFADGRQTVELFVFHVFTDFHASVKMSDIVKISVQAGKMSTLLGPTSGI